MNMIFIYLITYVLSGIFDTNVTTVDNPSQEEILQHLSYLASDELKGRGVDTPEIDSAAAYISSYFQEIGVKPIDAAHGYFQEFELERKQAPSKIELAIGDQSYLMNEGLVMLNGGNIEYNDLDIEYIEYGTEEDLENKSLEGKIVVTMLGYPKQNLMENYFTIMEKKRESIQESGAIALIEVYKSNSIPWERILRYFGGSGGLDIYNESEKFCHFFINDTTVINSLQGSDNIKGNLVVEVEASNVFKAKNVVGYIEGTDPTLKDEAILLGAHYDHVGIGRPVNDESGNPDSIYNGARDNATGTVALMLAARELVKKPPRRPVIFIAFTAEESGLIGSRYYASNPIISLEKIAFCFNNDNGGYNDTAITTLVGASRSNTLGPIEDAINSSGLEMYSSAELDQSFFGASDNISFSSKGVPSATYSLGFRGMDEEIRKYYHQPADEVETLDMDYITKWIHGYIIAARNIADMKEKPFWTEGDSLEKAGKELYGME